MVIKPPTRTYRPRETDVGHRLDHFLASVLQEMSRSKIQQMILGGLVLVNDQAAKPSYKVKSVDTISLTLPPPSVSQFTPEPIPLDVLYEDEDILVINKPAGLVVHPGAGNRTGTLANALAYHVQHLSGLSGPARPGIVHRLDKDTSGLMIVAKNDAVHERLAIQWQQGTVEKTYIGLVYGHPTPPLGKVEAPIGRHPTQRTKMAIRSEERGRQALTLYRVIETLPDASLLEIQLKTGRTHQVRVHLSSIQHPIVGDRLYGTSFKTKIKDPILRDAIDRLGRHCLHAAGLGLDHPRTGQRLSFHSDLPLEIEQLLRVFRSRGMLDRPNRAG